MTWPIWAALSAVFAALTAILAKMGVRDVPPNLATAIRTVVILACAWALVLGAGEHRSLAEIGKKSLFYLVLSGVATAASWLAYFRALSIAPASRVAPIDKAGLALTVLMSWAVLGEPLTWKLGAGVALIIGGALLTLS